MTIQEFLFDFPLYQEVAKDEGCLEIIDFITKDNFYEHNVDGYNPIEKCDSTFLLYCGINTAIVSSPGAVGSSLFTQYVSNKNKEFSIFEVVLKCKRYRTFLHFLVHIKYEEDGNENRQIKSISKVGQYPSVADFHIGKVHKYDKVLPKERMREFTKAIGLAANGVGIGSFVYLRRIFEHLVFEALEVAKKDKPEFDETVFISSRMNERIQMLSGYLPDFLVENHTIYGILSKGIHELSEDVCNKHFSILRESIEMILDEKLEAYQKEQKKKSIKQALSKIAGDIK